MLRSVIVGVGGRRARGHADAYQHLAKVRLVAISSRDRAKLDEFGERYAIGARYTDYREMFAAEHPDLVHVNTPPDVRLEVLEAAQEAGIPAVLVEKPIAIDGEDWAELQHFAASTRMRVAVNHQLHFHPRRAQLQAWVAEGRIGDIRFVEGSAGDTMAYQGTHTLQAICAFVPSPDPVAVLAQVAGAEGLRPNAPQHYAPDDCIAEITFADDARALLRVGRGARRVPQAAEIGTKWMHKRVAAYGTRGFVEWTMWSWAVNLDGSLEGGRHDYWAEDVLGQAGLTDSMADWLASGGDDHPLSLARALTQFNVVLGAYTSALDRRAVELPVAPRAGLIEELRVALGASSAESEPTLNRASGA